MAITLLHTASAALQTSASGVALPVTMPAAPTAGNPLLGFGCADGVATGGSGYTSLLNEDNAAQVQMSYKLAGASESTTQTFAATNESTGQWTLAVLFELAGAKAAGPTASTGKAAVAYMSGGYTALSITPTAAGAIFSCFAFESVYNPGTCTPATGWTMLTYAANNGSTNANFAIYAVILYRSDAASGTAYTPSFTCPAAMGASATTASTSFANYVAPGARRRTTAVFISAP